MALILNTPSFESSRPKTITPAPPTGIIHNIFIYADARDLGYTVSPMTLLADLNGGLDESKFDEPFTLNHTRKCCDDALLFI